MIGVSGGCFSVAGELFKCHFMEVMKANDVKGPSVDDDNSLRAADTWVCGGSEVSLSKLRKGDSERRSLTSAWPQRPPEKRNREILIFAHKNKQDSDHIWRDSESEQFHFHPAVAVMYINEALQEEPRPTDIIHSTGRFSV